MTPLRCRKCGAEIPEGSPVCRSCFEPVKHEGIMTRLGRLFGTAKLSMTNPSAPVRTHVNVKVTSRIKIRDAKTGEVREYHSLEEVPEEYRAKIREAEEAARAGQRLNKITITDASGKTHSFNSPDEMPPELRSLYEKAQEKL